MLIRSLFCRFIVRSDILNIVFRFLTIFNTYFSVSDCIKFSLNGKTYQNNSLVALEDIGEGDTALLCMTNLTSCCRRPYTGENGSAIGNCFFPNGTRVPSMVANETSGEVVICLNHRGRGEDGIYRCEIPDSMNVNQTIYIGVYTADNGE